MRQHMKFENKKLVVDITLACIARKGEYIVYDSKWYIVRDVVHPATGREGKYIIPTIIVSETIAPWGMS